MINLISHYIRRFLDAYRDTKRIVNHYDLIKLNGIYIIVKIFIIRFFYSFSFLRNYDQIKYKNEKIHSNYFIEKEINLHESLKKIDEIGYSPIYNISSDFKNSLLNVVLNSKNLDTKKIHINPNDLYKIKEETIEQYLKRLTKLKVTRISGFLDLNKQKLLKDFLTSKEILSVVENYLNCKGISINANFFISNPVEKSEKEKFNTAQIFHWDNDFKKFLKLYIYLTDVDSSAGPHLFVEKTHKFKKRRHRLCRVYSDNNIYKHYDNFKEFTGKSGSSFFVDSYGLHKGESPKEKSRIILNIHFGAGKILYTPGDVYFESN